MLLKVVKLIEHHSTEIIKVNSYCFTNVAEGGKVEILEWLLQKKKEGEENTKSGAKLHFIDDIDVDVMLHKACTKGHVKMAEKLLQLGANINHVKEEDYYSTPLHNACRGTSNDNQEMVQFLVERGAFVNGYEEVKLKGVQRLTPIEIALTQKNTGIAKILINYGADVTYTELLTKAVNVPGDDFDLVEMILQKTSRLYNDHEGAQLLVNAARCANEEIVKVLLKHRMKVLFLFFFLVLLLTLLSPSPALETFFLPLQKLNLDME